MTFDPRNIKSITIFNNLENHNFNCSVMLNDNDFYFRKLAGVEIYEFLRMNQNINLVGKFRPEYFKKQYFSHFIKKYLETNIIQVDVYAPCYEISNILCMHECFVYTQNRVQKIIWLASDELLKLMDIGVLMTGYFELKHFNKKKEKCCF